MEILIWVATGGMMGWIGYSYLGFNQERGRNVSIIIGAAGAVIGCKVLAPMFLTASAGGLGAAGVAFAAAAATAVLLIGNLVQNRWGV